MQQLVSHQNCFLRTKILITPQNLGIKVLNAKLQQSSEIYFLIKPLQDTRSKESTIFDNRDV